MENNYKIEIVESHGKTFKVLGGTYYRKDTPNDLVFMLENIRRTGQRVMFRWGDSETGADWGDEWDICGTIGRSMGPVKAPLLIQRTNSTSGGIILSHCTVRIYAQPSGTVLYSHPSYHHKAYKVVIPSDLPEYASMITVDGEPVCRFKRADGAQKWMDKLHFKEMQPA